MLIEQFNRLLVRFQQMGCTFASLDAETETHGLRRVVTGEQVMLFSNKNGSGYENLVRRRLAEAGKDPESFVLGDLPWGERVPNTPLIKHRGFYYLQTILLKAGDVNYYCGSIRVPPERVGDFINPRYPRHGLSHEKQVVVQTYALENIKGIRLLGEQLPTESKVRRKLSITTKEK